MIKEDTICAISTPPGNGAIAVIRLSGPEAIQIADRIFYSSTGSKKLAGQQPNTIHFGYIKDDEEIIDEVLVSLFISPNSYTGENLVEISCHGSEFIQEKLVQVCLKNGATNAKAGEFTKRAFLNGKMDLSRAEAVADLIASDSEASHRMAMNQMKGGFSSELTRLRQKLLDFISLLELELDFSEEDVEFANRKELAKLLMDMSTTIHKLADSFSAGNVLKNGVPVAIAGKTNVGKSTLLNMLMHEDKAIVSDIAGTTRDAIEDVIRIEGVNFRFIDTAGLRKTEDSIEKIGIAKAFQKIDQAYIVLYMVDSGSTVDEIDRLIGKIKKRLEGKVLPAGRQDKKLIILMNKTDRLSESDLKQRKELGRYKNLDEKDQILFISAKSSKDIDQLVELLAKIIRKEQAGSHDIIVTNLRHFEALSNAGEALVRAMNGLESGLSSDLLSMDIRQVLHFLGEITGEITTDEILGNIFSKFCIGK